MSVLSLGCGRVQAELSSYVDATLPPKRHEQFSYHLAGCADCRAELQALAAVCSKLSTCRSQATPHDLTAKLESIAGEHASAPLYMAHGIGTLPSRRRRNWLAQGSAALLVVMVSVVVLAVLVAPEPERINDPVAQGREAYLQSALAINVDQALGAVLLAEQHGAEFNSGVGYEPIHRDVPWEEISAEEVSGMLHQPELTMSGTQVAYVADGQGTYYQAQVELASVAGVGTQLEVLDERGHGYETSYLPAFAAGAVIPNAAWRFVRFGGAVEVADRPAVQLAAFTETGMVGSWWVDQETGLVLWSERYANSGAVTVAVGYRDLHIGAAQVESDWQTVVLQPVTASGTTGWCVGLKSCPQVLGGLPLVGYASGSGTMTLVYSDGLETAVVSSANGVLTKDAATSAEAAAGLPSVTAWQCGTSVITFASNAPKEHHEAMLAELPGEESYRRSAVDRVAAGLERLAGVDSPS